jgi:adenylosuccinate lyase
MLKELTRGKRVDHAGLTEFVNGLDIGEAARQRLLALTPPTYTGLAASLVDDYLR